MAINPLAAAGQSDPRLLLARQLLGNTGTPRTIGQGINSAGNQIIGAMLAREGLDAQRERSEAARDTLLSALDLPGMAGDNPAQRLAIANLLTDPNVMAQPGAQPIIGMLLQGLQGEEPTNQFRNFMLAQENPGFQDFLETTGSAPSASVTIEEGALAPTRATQNRLQADTLDTQATQQRLNDIAGSFRPEFLEIPTKIGMDFSAFRDRLGSITEIFGIPELTVEQKQELADYTTFTSRTLNNLNITLNQLSGAAVNEQEFARIQEALPNTTDGPTEFQAKLTNAIRDMNRSLIRLNIAQRQGLDPLNSGITLDGVDRLINEEGQRIRQSLEGQGLSAEEVDAIVQRSLRQMFFGG